MKTLKEELQEILDKQKLSDENPFICHLISDRYRETLKQYKIMASDYAPNFYSGRNAWWGYFGNTATDQEFILLEKYRFIKDLIAIL